MKLSPPGQRKLRIAVFIAFVAFGLLAQPASAFIDPPVLVPENPVAGETVSVSIRSGECDGFHAVPPQITQTGNAIHMLLATSHYDDPLWCNSPIFTSTFEVGSFPSGTYTLHVERFYDNAVPVPVYETLANFEFTVRGTSATALPSIGAWGLLLLMLGVLALVAWRHRSGGQALVSLVFIAGLAMATTSRAQEPHLVEVQLSNAFGSPTPDEVVLWVGTSPGGEPPLAAFNVVGPIGVNYLLSHRASGELQAWIEQNPSCPRAARQSPSYP